MIATVAAGNGTRGSAANQLNDIRWIYVDGNFDLYVTDSGNHGVQQFKSGKQNGVTRVRNGSSTYTIPLTGPTEVVLDSENYLFIVDHCNHRIVGSNQNGFRCLVGCSGRCSQAHQLSDPYGLSFDRDGNIFVSDRSNRRIQKFSLKRSSCPQQQSQRNKVSRNKIFKKGIFQISDKTDFSATIEQTSMNSPKSTIFFVLIAYKTDFLTATEQISTNSNKNTSEKVFGGSKIKIFIYILKEDSEIREIRFIAQTTDTPPIHIRRDHNFYILAIIKLNCPKSFQVNFILVPSIQQKMISTFPQQLFLTECMNLNSQFK
ncbi:unnamed protein product [Adineta ricciae]|uniref:NHL repeat containing protein-like protein n=1 Tax=Adineta ricciae TaxID=249248 RepID=A0A814W8U6_ADIRI|nr:unnamed protein product [Adineta ricciae]